MNLKKKKIDSVNLTTEDQALIENSYIKYKSIVDDLRDYEVRFF